MCLRPRLVLGELGPVGESGESSGGGLGREGRVEDRRVGSTFLAARKGGEAHVGQDSAS